MSNDEIKDSIPEVERPDYSKLGRRWSTPHGKATVLELVDGSGKDTGERIVINDPGAKTADRYSVVRLSGDDAELAAEAALGKDYLIKIPARPAPPAAVAPSAIQATRDRVDVARRGMARDDLADAGDWLRTAAAHVEDDGIRRHLTAADRAIREGDADRASIALDAASGPAGRDRERAEAIALESAHQTRSREEWDAKLGQRGYGLVPSSNGNKTEWKLEDRRTGQSYALADVGFQGDAAPEKIEEQWRSGMAADLRKTLETKDILSTRRPAAAKPLGPEVGDRARRADEIRHGEENALTAAIVALPPEQAKAAFRAKSTLLADRARQGIGDTRVTAAQLDERLKADGVSFGAEITPDGGTRSIGFAEALSKAEPAPETRDHMKKWLAGTVWSAQNSLLSENKVPSWENYQTALADRGVEVSRAYDGDSKTYAYRYSTSMPGIGRFDHAEQELGFDASKDPRLSTHAFVESGDRAAFMSRANSALAVAVDKAQHASLINKIAKPERERVAEALREQGMELRIMQQEFLGQEKDGKAVYGIRLGVEDPETGRIAALSELGYDGTDYAKLGSKVHMLGGAPKVEKFDAKQAWDMFTDGFKQSLAGVASGFDAALTGGRVNFNAGKIDIWQSMKKTDEADGPAKPLRRPSWERQDNAARDTQQSRLPSM
jgi:hypothetical protein